ncbi:MAG TPA: malectin domain-containing carbohydrate-binding protein [Polyangia bacterium]|nr:malectin domain-containing carbohydrate-binding protein [Polyangia bacterium]
MGVLAGGAFVALAVTQGCTKTDSAEPEVVVETAAATAKIDWLQFGGGPSHSGNNTQETQVSQSTVSGLKQLFQVSLPETAEGQPVVLTGVATSSGTHDVVFVTTRNGYLVAMDAYTGATIWKHQFGSTNITMSSPAIDPGRSLIYTVGLDGYIHKVNVKDGTEVTGGGWPELATLKTNVEKDGTALGWATVGGTTYLYLGAGGYDGDGGNYQGHVTTVNLNTGAQKVFNAMCSNRTDHISSPDCAGAKSGIWAKAGLTFDSLTNRLYAATGNGTYQPSSFYWGDSILALNPDGSGNSNGNPLDSYTPSNYQSLQNSDKDLGSTNMVILPNNGSKYPHLGMQSGKDQELRLINLDNMSGQGGPGKVAGEISTTALATGGEVQNPVATWINPADNKTWVFVVSPSNGINASRLDVDGSGKPTLTNVWHTGGGGGGAHVANNVLYWASNGNIHALNPTTGAQLWNNTTIGQIHWQTPEVVNGVLYITDSGRKITAFSINGQGGGGGGSGGSGGSTGSGGAAGSINAGGPAVSPFVADTDFAGGTTINHANTIDTSGVTNPAPAAVYQTARTGNFTYTIPGFTAGSSHTVRLHFCETYFTTAGSRKFNVSINGTQVLAAYDIFAATGAKNKAIVREFPTAANASGQYVVQFTSVVNNSLVSGIEIP